MFDESSLSVTNGDLGVNEGERERAVNRKRNARSQWLLSYCLIYANKVANDGEDHLNKRK